jgi:hypothetical protein
LLNAKIKVIVHHWQLGYLRFVAGGSKLHALDTLAEFVTYEETND